MYRIAICEDEPSMAQENEAMICRILEARHFQRDIDFSISSGETIGIIGGTLIFPFPAFRQRDRC